MVFNENIIFNRKTKDLIDNLIHSTLLEIAAYIRTIKLLPLASSTRTKSFLKDDESLSIVREEEDPLGYYNGRKI